MTQIRLLYNRLKLSRSPKNATVKLSRNSDYLYYNKKSKIIKLKKFNFSVPRYDFLDMELHNNNNTYEISVNIDRNRLLELADHMYKLENNSEFFTLIGSEIDLRKLFLWDANIATLLPIFFLRDSLIFSIVLLKFFSSSPLSSDVQAFSLLSKNFTSEPLLM